MYVLMVESMKAAACCVQDLRTGSGQCFPTWFVSLAFWSCQGHAKWLLSGVPIEGAVKVGERISKKLGLTDGLDFPPRWPFSQKIWGHHFWDFGCQQFVECRRRDATIGIASLLACLVWENGW